MQQVFVAFNGKCAPIKVRNTESNGAPRLCHLKRKLEGTYGIPVHEQNVVFGNLVLERDLALQDYGIMEGSAVTLVTRSITLKTFTEMKDAVALQKSYVDQHGLQAKWVAEQAALDKVAVFQGGIYHARTAPTGLGGLLGLTRIYCRDSGISSLGGDYTKANELLEISVENCRLLQTRFTGAQSCPRSLECLRVKGDCLLVRVDLDGLAVMRNLKELECNGSVFINTDFDPKAPKYKRYLPLLRTVRLTDTNVGPALEQLLRDRVRANSSTSLFTAVVAQHRHWRRGIIPPEIWMMIADFLVAISCVIQHPKPDEIVEID
jgi:hypothetical protein